MAFSNLVKKIKNNVKLPPFIIFQNLLNKIPLRPFQVGRFFWITLSKPNTTTIRGGGEVRIGSLNDVSEMCKLDDKKDLFSRRFNEGELCIVAVSDNKIIGYVWFSDKPIHIEERLHYRLSIPSDSIYAYDGLIKSENRLGGAWHHIMKFMHEYAQTIGRQKIIAMVDYGNDPSIKAHLRYGFDITRDVYWLKIFNKIVFKAEDCEPGSFPPKKALM